MKVYNSKNIPKFEEESGKWERSFKKKPLKKDSGKKTNDSNFKNIFKVLSFPFIFIWKIITIFSNILDKIIPRNGFVKFIGVTSFLAILISFFNIFNQSAETVENKRKAAYTIYPARRGNIYIHNATASKDISLTSAELVSTIKIDAKYLKENINKKNLNQEMVVTKLASELNIPWNEINELISKEISKANPGMSVILKKNATAEQGKAVQRLREDIENPMRFMYWILYTPFENRSYNLLGASAGSITGYAQKEKVIKGDVYNPETKVGNENCYQMVLDNEARGTVDSYDRSIERYQGLEDKEFVQNFSPVNQLQEKNNRSREPFSEVYLNQSTNDNVLRQPLQNNLQPYYYQLPQNQYYSQKIDSYTFHKERKYTFLTTVLTTTLFLASIAFWFWIVQPIILEKIVNIYTSKQGYIPLARSEAIKQTEKIDQVVAAGKADIKNIKTLGCTNNNAELNIKKFEQVNYRVLPQDEAIVSGFHEGNVDKIYLNYIVDINKQIEQYLLNQDMGTLAGNIQSLNNLSVNCARSIERYQGLEDKEFVQKVCLDLNNNILRFGIADSFTLNNICNKDQSKAFFLEDLDKFVEESADMIQAGAETTVLQNIDQLVKEAENNINNYYNKRINFPSNIYLLRAKK